MTRTTSKPPVLVPLAGALAALGGILLIGLSAYYLIADSHPDDQVAALIVLPIGVALVCLGSLGSWAKAGALLAAAIIATVVAGILLVAVATSDHVTSTMLASLSHFAVTAGLGYAAFVALRRQRRSVAAAS